MGISFEAARAAKIYLQAQPIVDAAALVPSGQSGDHGFKGSAWTLEDKAYCSLLTGSINQDMRALVREGNVQLAADSIYTYSGIVAGRLIRSKPASLRLLSERGILHPDSYQLMTDRRQFDTISIAQASLDMVLEYQNANLPFPHQTVLLRRLFPLSYIEWMKDKYAVLPWVYLHYARSAPFPHMAIEEAMGRANVLVEKHGWTFNKAFTFVAQRPAYVSAILSGSSEPSETAGEAEKKSADEAQGITPDRREYEEARASKAYLQVQPIIDAAVRVERTMERTALQGGIILIKTGYAEKLRDAMREMLYTIAKAKGIDLQEHVLLQIAQRTAMTLVKIPQGLSNDLIARGILSPEEYSAITKGELFDVRPVAEAVMDLVAEYQDEGLYPLDQVNMIKRFSPVSYLKWIKARSNRSLYEIMYYFTNSAFPHVHLGIPHDAAILEEGEREEAVNEKAVLPTVVDRPIKEKAVPMQAQPIVISVSSETYENARKEKVYLRAQPILDVALRPGFDIEDYRSGHSSGWSELYNSEQTGLLADSLREALNANGSPVIQRNAKEYAYVIANGIRWQRPKTLELLVQRGVLSPEDIMAILEGREFDVTRIAEVASDLISEYEKAGIPLDKQLILLRRFMPVEYFNKMRKSGCYDSVIFDEVRGSNIPHITIDIMADLAVMLMKKWNVPEYGARKMAFIYSERAVEALEGTEPEARGIFKNCRAAFEERSATQPKPAPKAEINVSPKTSGTARSEKAYLRVNPIIDAARRVAETGESTDFTGRISDQGSERVEMEYREKLAGSIENDLVELCKAGKNLLTGGMVSQCANRVTLSLLHMPQGSLNDLAARGILSPEERVSINKLEMFDTRALAEAVLDMMSEYQGHGFSDTDQLFMIRRFYPLSYYNWIIEKAVVPHSTVLYHFQTKAFPHVALGIPSDTADPEKHEKESVRVPVIRKEKRVSVSKAAIKEKTVAPVSLTQAELPVSLERYEEARNVRAYLLADPIVAEARSASGSHQKFVSKRTYAASEYAQQLAVKFGSSFSDLAGQSGIPMTQDEQKKYSNTVAESLSRRRSQSLWQLSARGIISPDSVILASGLKPFDISPVADATWQMIVEYKEQGIKPDLQFLLLTKFFPASYLQMMRSKGLPDSTIFFYVDSMNYPHLAVERLRNLADSLVERWKVPFGSAVRMAIERANMARQTLTGTEEEAREMFAKYHVPFEEKPLSASTIKAARIVKRSGNPVNLVLINLRPASMIVKEASKTKPVRVIPQIPLVLMLMPDEVTARMPEFKAAKEERLYLQYQPIVDAAKADIEKDKLAVDAQTLPYLSENEYVYRRKKLAGAINTAMSNILRRKPKAIEQQIIPDYSRAIAGLLMSMSPADLMGLAKRGIISPEDAYLVGKREQFDVTDMAEAAFDLISGYRTAKIPYKEQIRLLKRFLPASYCDWTKRTYGLTDDQLSEFMGRSGLLHVEVKNAIDLANALVSKWNVQQKDANSLARKYPLRAREALDAKEPRLAANIFESFRFEFPISHFISRVAAVPETIEKTTVFAPAKRSKLYLKAEPIIKAGSELLENELANYELKKDIDEQYAARLAGLIEENLVVIAAKRKMAIGAALLRDHANSIARGLLSQRTVSLLLLSDRGIMTRSSILAISRNEDFDTIPVAEAALDLIEEYKKAGLGDIFQGLMLEGMLPVSYLHWMTRTYNMSNDDLKPLISKEVFPHRAYDRAGAMATALVAKHGVNFKDAMRVAAESNEDAKKALSGTLSDAARVFAEHGVPFEEKKPEIGIRVITMRPSLSLKAGDLYYGDKLYFDRYMVVQLSGKNGISSNMVKKAQQMLALHENDVNIYDVLFVLLRYPNNPKEIMAVVFNSAKQLAVKYGISMREAMFYAKCHPFTAEKEYAKILEKYNELRKKYTVDGYTTVNTNTIMFFLKKYGEDAEYQLEKALAMTGELSGRTGVDPSDIMSHIMVHGDDAGKYLKGTVAAAERLTKEYTLSMSDAMFCVQLYPGDPVYAAVEICVAKKRSDIAAIAGDQ